MAPPDTPSVVAALEREVAHASFPVNPSINSLVAGFIKYLKEPRYHSPLTLPELSGLFASFYHDLNSIATTSYTLSNSTKKQLIAGCKYFRQNPQKFDYLLAIANYSSSSIKLVKRDDDDAVLQLRVFSFYKVLVVLEAIDRAQFKLFRSISNKQEDISLYDKLFRFDERDLIVQDFFCEKLRALRALELPFRCFIESDVDEKVLAFFDKLTADQIAALNDKLSRLSACITPYSKMRLVVQFQKKLITFLAQVCDVKLHQINNDILLPTSIYFVIYKSPLANVDLFLNFNFIKNFVNLIDPYNVSVFNSTSHLFSSYDPTDTSTKNANPKTAYRKTTLFECLNLDESSDSTIDTTEFFKTDKELIQYLHDNCLNSSEAHYYLTNLEAVLFFIQNVTVSELAPDIDTTDPVLTVPLSQLVDKEVLSQFQFPEGEENPEADAQPERPELRSRSSSLFNTLTLKLNDAANRSRSNSSIFNKRETFPSLAANDNTTTPVDSNESHTAADANNNSLSMMKNLIERFSSVSVPQFTREDEGINSKLDDYKHRRASSLMNRLSPNHSRTRSSSLELSTVAPQRKATIASKLSTGVSEIMTKFNSTSGVPANNANVALRMPEEDGEASTIVPKSGDHSRSRTTSLQVMEKWFNNISTSQKPAAVDTGVDSVAESNSSSLFSTPAKELTRFHNVDFDSLTIADLRTLKSYYDQLCTEVSVAKYESKSTHEDLESADGAGGLTYI